MIEVRNLEKSFGSQKVLDGVNLRIETGESVVIMGRSGGGKSVLLKHIIGLLQPDSGEVLIDGENIEPMDERELLRVRSKFGMLFQGAALFDSMTVAENVAFAFRRKRNMSQGEIDWKGGGSAGGGGFAGDRKQKSPRNSRAECASAWDWPGRSFTSRKSSFTMSRRPV